MMKPSFCFFAVIAGVTTLQAEDPTIEVVRGARWVQSGASTVVAASGTNAFYFQADATGLSGLEPVTGAQMTTPGGQSLALADLGDGSFVYVQNFSTQTARDAAFPNGHYGFSANLNFIGLAKAHATLAEDVAPAVPQLVNYTGAQSIDPAADFTFTFNSFTGAGSSDLITYEIRDAGSGQLLTQLTDIDPSNTEWSFSAGDLPPSRNFLLSAVFKKIGAPGFPDAGELLLGETVYISETTIPVRTTVAGGGQTDTTPPSLSQVIPADGGVMNSTYDSVLFTFSEAMDTSASALQWSATQNGQPLILNPVGFHYFWGTDSKTLICTYNSLGGGVVNGGWPAGVLVNWTLNDQAGAAGSFSDLAGNKLPRQAGSFVTAGGLNPCDTNAPAGLPLAAFIFSKQVNYLQLSTNAPVGDPDLGAQALAVINGPSTFPPIPLVTLKVPTANPFQFFIKPLSSLSGSADLGFRVFEESFASRADLDASYIAGNYLMELRDNTATPTASATLVVPATGYPPIPHFSNFAGAQTINADGDFTLSWDAYTGATTNTAYTAVTVYDSSSNIVFRLPDLCRGTPLAPAAANATIPAKMLARGANYTVQLDFEHIVDQNKTIAGIPGSGMALLRRTTRAVLSTLGDVSPVTAAKFGAVQLASDGTLQFNINCTPGHDLILEAADSLGGTYSTILTTNPPASPFTYSVPITGSGRMFRARNP